MKNTFGSDLSLTIFGESHGRAVGAVLDGMVGDYAIALPDGDGEPRWQVKYGLKAYCPVAEGFGFSHCDDFGNARSFGYRRRHLGNDLMGNVGSPIVAVESGVVEELGWNQYGGWRIGIRSFDGRRYYYYAHLRKGAPTSRGSKRGASCRRATSSAISA